MSYSFTTDFGGGIILAPCLQVLCAEIAQRHPDAVNLGEIGDSSHQGEGYSSDHNPFITHAGKRYVRAIDIGGPAAIQQALFAFFQRLYAEKDPRVYPYGYVHKDNVITTWFGDGATHADPGDVGHLHISVTQADGNRPSSSGWVPALDSRAPWGLASTNQDQEDELNAQESAALKFIYDHRDGLNTLLFNVNGGSGQAGLRAVVGGMRTQLLGVAQKVGAASSGGVIDPKVIVDAIADDLGKEVAEQVLDGLQARLRA